MEDLLKEETYSFVSPRDKKFIIAFDAEMDRLGYPDRPGRACGAGKQGIRSGYPQ